MNAEQRPVELGLSLPILPRPITNYVRFKKAGDFIHLSGQPPILSDGTPVTGKVGADVTTAEAHEQTKPAGLGHLSEMREAARLLDEIGIIKLLGMPNVIWALATIPRRPTAARICWKPSLANAVDTPGHPGGMGSLPGGNTVEYL